MKPLIGYLRLLALGAMLCALGCEVPDFEPVTEEEMPIDEDTGNPPTTSPTTPPATPPTTKPTTRKPTSTVVPNGAVLTNPAISEGVGFQQMVYWKTYDPPHLGRKVTIRWPSDLYWKYGCTASNTRCEADGASFTFYQLDTGDGANARLSYACTSRYMWDFPYKVRAILYKDGQPIAAFVMDDPTQEAQFRLPDSVQLP
jgi:hypothetical protein